MGYDDVVLHIGELGRYQRKIYFALCLPSITCAFHEMGGVFLAAKTDFRCLLPQENSANATYSLPLDFANMNYPWDNETKSWPQCERYNFNPLDQFNATDGNLSASLSAVKCDSFVHDKSQYALTTTTEWNLVCEDAWLRATGDSLFMVGMMLGSLIFGGLSDKYGRRVTLALLLIVQFISGILVAVSPKVIWYMISRTIVGSTINGIMIVAYVLMLEMVSPKKRLLIETCHLLSFTFGYVLITGLAYFITNWRTLQLAYTLPSIAFLAHWWLVPESVRWLLTKGRLQEAKELLHKAAAENGVELSSDTLNSLLSKHSESEPDIEEPSVFDLFRYPNLRKKTLLICFTWFVNSCTYYGLSWNTSDLEGNEYVNFGISASLEVPAFLFMFATLDKWGRKTVLCGSLLLAGTSLLCTLLVPSDMRWMVVVFAMMGKFAISCSNATLLVFAGEQFPTVIRNVGLGVCGISGRSGAILAPYINLLAEAWRPLPLVIFGTCSLIAGLLSLILPETLNKKLPESIQDGERFGNGDILISLPSNWYDFWGVQLTETERPNSRTNSSRRPKTLFFQHCIYKNQTRPEKSKERDTLIKRLTPPVDETSER